VVRAATAKAVVTVARAVMAVAVETAVRVAKAAIVAPAVKAETVARAVRAATVVRAATAAITTAPRPSSRPPSSSATRTDPDLVQQGWKNRKAPQRCGAFLSPLASPRTGLRSAKPEPEPDTIGFSMSGRAAVGRTTYGDMRCVSPFPSSP